MKTLFEKPDKTQAQQEFEKFDRENPEVWSKFVDVCFKLIKKGFKRYSSKAIFEYIRFHTLIETTDKVFKINNIWTPFYSRKFQRVYPQYKEFFEIRKSKAE